MRVFYIDKARKGKKKVCRCGHEIQPGEPYKYATPRYGGRKIWCAKCRPRPSELTGAKYGPLLDTIEDFDSSTLETVDDAKQALEDIAGEAREIMEEYEEAIENMPEQFQESSPAAEQMREYMEGLESYADTLESFDPSVDPEDEMDEDERAPALETVRDEADQLVNDLML